MKRCPQCNTVFDDSLDFCTNDGTPLIKETFVMPSENSAADAEEITVVRHESMTIDIPNPNAPGPTEQFNFPPLPVQETVVPVVEKRRNAGKYMMFMILGSIFGGGIVLAGVLFWVYLNQKKETQITVNANPKVSASATPTVRETTTATPITAGAKHENRTGDSDDEFNGRVISQNAYVRASPNRNSKEVDILPVDDRLDIEERENEDSPWYRVTCEHGTTGWMHGNTIEYTR